MALPTPDLIRQAAARADIASFIVMDVMVAAAKKEAEGHRVIHMEVGQPSTAAPLGARRAVLETMDRDPMGYTVALGMPALRERIAKHYKDRYGLTISPERVVVTMGSSGAFILAFLTLFDIGQTVGLPNPGYPCYRHILSTLGMKPTLIDTGPETRWMPTPEAIDAAAEKDRIAGLLIASPSNPTGTMLTPDRLAAIVDVCLKRKIWFISDEIYHGLAYGVPETTALALTDQTIIINSFSKYFSMTGWRVGWMIVPDGLVRTVERLAQNLFICPPAVAQVAALGAFDSIDELEQNRSVYQANRDVLLEGLPRVGFDKIVPADGAFYLYADVSKYTNDASAFCRAMIEETGVAATPGVDFDAARGHQFVRFSYSRSTDDMREAVARLGQWARLRG
jgi:aspartate/methionine/tyrosine aminotransferase